ncbi:aldo/keto reductase [Streptomyces sp. NPDC006368]|uniref:aldo/keto reductase n=1 Tax=Streptomyces sp. NPDC006368 TaxID=3156760 RepID=UPI00339E494A
MEHVRLGTTGLKVSRLCLGTMTFGSQCDEEVSRKVLDRADDAGITFLDTADVYPLGGDDTTVGRTEEILGGWLKGRRNRFVVATKCFGRTGPAAWDGGNSRRHIMEAVEQSLRRLRTDWIDLYQLHAYDPETPLDETLEALDDLVRSGKVRYVGCSNFLAYQVARALGRSEVRGLTRMVSVQPRYNLLFRPFERELFPLCQEEGLGVITYNPLAGGLLTGKYTPRQQPSEGRFALPEAGRMYRDRYWRDAEFRAVDSLHGIAREAGLTLGVAALAWVMANPAVTAPIVGVSSPEQLDTALTASGTRLDPEVKARLDKATRIFRWGDASR